MGLNTRSLKSHEGVIIVDNRDVGAMPFNNNQAMQEIPAYTCSHCHRVVVLHPTRQRERAFCGKCNHRICDECEARRVAAGGECKTMNQIIEETQENAVKEQQQGLIIL